MGSVLSGMGGMESGYGMSSGGPGYTFADMHNLKGNTLQRSRPVAAAR